ncbi:MAG: CHRD domain-containing protein [Nitrospirota bacterium]|nr:CHRD domain-containing protein [Nitrospirota bacterium]
MMWLRAPLFVVYLMGVFAGTNAYADTMFVANLTNAQEVPPVNPTTATGSPRPASFGTATFVLNTAQTAMTFSATIFNIDVTGSQTVDANDNLVAAHIHAGPTVAPGVIGPVVWGFFGMPFNDNNPNDVVMTPFATGVGGTFSGKWDAPEGNNTTLAAQLPNILAGRSYINFHTTQFTGGEIRGAINAVPEPSALVLFSTGAAGILGLGWFRVLRSRRNDNLAR